MASMRLPGEASPPAGGSGGGAWAARGCLARRRLPSAKPLALEPTARRQAQHAETHPEHHQGGRLGNVVVPDEVLVLPASVGSEPIQICREAAEPSQP